MHIEVETTHTPGPSSPPSGDARTIETAQRLDGDPLRTARHDFKNHLQLLSSILNLQRRRTDNSEALDIIEATYARIMCLATLHQLLDTSPNSDEVSLSELIAALLRYHRRSHVHFSSSFDGEDLMLPSKRALPLALIVNELIISAMRSESLDGQHSAESTSISVKISRDENDGTSMLLIERRPPGAGPAMRAKDLFAEQLASSLCAQIKGQMRITSDGEGTREFNITF